MNLVIYADGASRGNGTPGSKSGCGVVVFNEAESIKLYLLAKQLPDGTTNNRAEMHALIEALCIINSERGLSAVIKTDSNLLVQSINKGWKRKLVS